MNKESIKINKDKLEEPKIETPSNVEVDQNINEDIQSLADEKIANIDSLNQDKVWTEAEIKQFEYLGGEADEVESLKKEAEKRIAPIKQKMQSLAKKAKKAIIMLATITNLYGQAEASNGQSKDKDKKEDLTEGNINLNAINADDPKLANYEDYLKTSIEPDLDQSLEPVLEGPEGKIDEAALKSRLAEAKDLSSFSDEEFVYIINNFSISEEQRREISTSQISNNLEKFVNLQPIIDSNMRTFPAAVGLYMYELGLIDKSKEMLDNENFWKMPTDEPGHMKSAWSDFKFHFDAPCTIKNGELISDKARLNLQTLSELNGGAFWKLLHESADVTIEVVADGTIIINLGNSQEQIEKVQRNGENLKPKIPVLPEGLIIQANPSKTSDQLLESSLDLVQISQEMKCSNCKIYYDHSVKKPAIVIERLPGLDDKVEFATVLSIEDKGNFILDKECSKLFLFDNLADANEAKEKLGDIPFVVVENKIVNDMLASDIIASSSKDSKVKFFAGNRDLYAYEEEFRKNEWVHDYVKHEEIPEKLVDELKDKYGYSDFSGIENGKYVGESPMFGTDKGSSAAFKFSIEWSGGDGGYLQGVIPVEIDGKQYTKKSSYIPFSDASSELGETVIKNGNYQVSFTKERADQGNLSKKAHNRDVELPTYEQSLRFSVNDFAPGTNDRGVVPMIIEAPQNQEDVSRILMGAGGEIAVQRSLSTETDNHVAFTSNYLPVTDLIDDYAISDTTGNEIIVRGSSLKTFNDLSDQWQSKLSENGKKLRLRGIEEQVGRSDYEIDLSLVRLIDSELQKNPALQDMNIDLYTAKAASAEKNMVIAQWNRVSESLEFSEYLVIDFEGFTDKFMNADRSFAPSSVIKHEINHGLTFKVAKQEKEQGVDASERYVHKVDHLVTNGFENIKQNSVVFTEKFKNFLVGMGVIEAEANDAVDRFKSSDYSPEVLMNAVYGTVSHNGAKELSEDEIKLINLNKKILEQAGYKQEYIEEYLREQVYPGGFDVFEGVVKPNPSDSDYEQKLENYTNFTKYFQETTGLASFYACNQKPPATTEVGAELLSPLYPEVTTTLTERGNKVNLDKFLNGSKAEQKTVKDWIEMEFKAGIQTFLDYTYYMRHKDNRYEEVFDGGYQGLNDINKIEDASKKQRLINLYNESL